jgi:hypothetical protein
VNDPSAPHTPTIFRLAAQRAAIIRGGRAIRAAAHGVTRLSTLFIIDAAVNSCAIAALDAHARRVAAAQVGKLSD